MRATIAAALMIVTTAVYAEAQPAGTNGRAKPKLAAAHPVAQTPADTASAMAPAERQTLQSDLAWTGHYNGIINGEVSDRLIAAIKTFQKDQGGKQTGVLNPQERSVLAAAARKSRGNVGWKTITDAGTGARLGLPARLVPQQSSDGNGTKWGSATGTIQIMLTRRKDANLTTAKLADLERKEPVGRKIDYSAVKPDFFVLSGMQGLKKFYARGQLRGSEARILTILYDQATEGTMEPVVIAMSSAFDPFPANGGPPPRKTVEYGTGVTVSSDGAIVTDLDVVDGCQSIVVAGHGNADRIADDKDHGLTLLRIYGAHGLQPIALDGGTAKGGVDLVGIADPQNQGGGSAVSRVKASVAQGGGEPALSPTPASGFSGAAALDTNGKFAGLALLKPATVAGLSTPAAQAVLAQAEVVQAFLKANKVTAVGSSDAKAAVVRIICVRK
ncbi:serine protease [Nitrobacter sp. JJSN]|uniref:serine protease n=1 Tax=Nitrobacter sp. JJSN TaxID=3453033 RepID=UPI003F77542D